MAKFKFLSLNFSKTENLITGLPNLIKNLTNVPSFNLDATTIFPYATVRSLGITFDLLLTLVVYISKLSKVAFLQLRCIAQLRYASPKDAESLVHTIITSHLIYGNAVFAGLPVHYICRL